MIQSKYFCPLINIISVVNCKPFPVPNKSGPSAPRRCKKRCRIIETSDMNTSDVLKFLAPCAPLQLGTVGSTSDVGGIYVFVWVTNSGILTRNMPKLALFLHFHSTYEP